MLNFRQFEAGPDPFGRKFQVLFKYQQNGISIRHANTVEVAFVVTGGEDAAVKTIALPHPDLVKLSESTGRAVDDSWCSRLAAMHLLHLVETGEDMEKDYITAPLADLEQYAGAVEREERGYKIPHPPPR